MARALIVQHAAHEGLGWLQDWLPQASLDVHPIHPYLGHRVPTSVEGDALIVLGGPMGCMDDDKAAWLPAVRTLMRTAVDDGVPTLGIMPLPGSLSDAIKAMEASELMAETLGEHVFDFFLRNKRTEWDAYRQQVTPFELSRYLPVL